MKAQYFGDVNDYRKYALLRLLAKSGEFKIGVCWMLTPADERPDGGKRSYIQHPAKWRAFDIDLFDLLAAVRPKSELTDLLQIESEGLIPGATFFNEIVPDALDAPFIGCLRLQQLPLFFDHDNGLEIKSRPKGQKNSSKFVFRDEISDHYAARRSVLLYQYYARRPRTKFPDGIAVRLTKALPQG